MSTLSVVTREYIQNLLINIQNFDTNKDKEVAKVLQLTSTQYGELLLLRNNLELLINLTYAEIRSRNNTIAKDS